MLDRPGRWLVLLRAALVVVGAIAVALTDFPPSYEGWAWAVVGFFAAVTVFSGVLSVVDLGSTDRIRARIVLLGLDAVVAIGFISIFSFETGEPWRALYLIPIAAAALRFGLVGGLVGAVVMTGATVVIDALGPGLQWRTAFAPGPRRIAGGTRHRAPAGHAHRRADSSRGAGRGGGTAA